MRALLALPLLALAGLLAALAAVPDATVRGTAGSAGDPVPGPRTVLLVRHAETAESTESVRDPELSELGERRAADLARLLSSAGVTHLFASEYRRTGATLAPLAAARELEVEVVPAREAEVLLARLGELPGGAVAVVAGHSNTVPGLVASLGGEVRDLVEHPEYGPMLDSRDYDRLFVVHLAPENDGDDARASTLELRYGSDE